MFVLSPTERCKAMGVKNSPYVVRSKPIDSARVDHCTHYSITPPIELFLRCHRLSISNIPSCGLGTIGRSFEVTARCNSRSPLNCLLLTRLFVRPGPAFELDSDFRNQVWLRVVPTIVTGSIGSSGTINMSRKRVLHVTRRNPRKVPLRVRILVRASLANRYHLPMKDQLMSKSVVQLESLL